MTEAEIVKETIYYYSEDPSRRAIEDGKCLYVTSDDRRCAFGRCMEDEYLDRIPSAVLEIEGLLDILGLQSHDELLQEEYRGHNLDFWRRLQFIHDEGDWQSESGVIVDNHTRKWIDQLLTTLT